MQAKNDTNYVSEPGESSHDYEPDETGPLPTRVKLYNKLRALEVEIDAVASSIGSAKCIEGDGSGNSDSTSVRGDKPVENIGYAVHAPSGNLCLEQALATDRLRDLKKAKAQLQKEISLFGDYAFANDIEHEKHHVELLDELVKERPKQKPKHKQKLKSNGHSKQPLKAVAYGEDADFDTVLDAASAGFMETVIPFLSVFVLTQYIFVFLQLLERSFSFLFLHLQLDYFLTSNE